MCEFMINRTIYIITILLSCLSLLTTSCSVSRPYGMSKEQFQDQKELEKDKEAAAKAYEKARKEAAKEFWSMQSKEVKKRIKKNNKKRSWETKQRKRR